MLSENLVVNDVCVTGLTFIGSLLVLRLWEETAKREIFNQKLNRKLVHISFGLVFMLFWPLFSYGRQAAILAALIPGINIIRMLLLGLGIWRDDATVKSMSRHGDYRELLKGPLCYACSLTLASAYWRTSPIATAIICNLCAGDGVADMVGRQFGVNKLPYNRNKSYAGSIAMASAGFITCFGYMHYFALFGFLQESYGMVLGFLIVSIATALVESLPIHAVFDDNLTVTLTSVFGGMGYLTLETWGSQTLRSLAEQLLVYKPLTHLCDSEEDTNESDGGVVRAIERRAAVLICLFEGDQGELRVILTKRSYNLTSHPGEVALPGGKMEEGDVDDSATALREAKEEIGLDPALVRVVAFLEPFISKNLLKVTPVVGLLEKMEDFKPIINIDEVDTIFHAPLEMFLEEKNHRFEEKDWMDWKYITHLFDYESEQGNFLIWGLTAGILIRAASIIFQRSPPYTEHLPDFQEIQRACMSLI